MVKKGDSGVGVVRNCLWLVVKGTYVGDDREEDEQFKKFEGGIIPPQQL